MPAPGMTHFVKDFVQKARTQVGGDHWQAARLLETWAKADCELLAAIVAPVLTYRCEKLVQQAENREFYAKEKRALN